MTDERGTAVPEEKHIIVRVCWNKIKKFKKVCLRNLL